MNRVLAALLLAWPAVSFAVNANYRSHPPVRPLSGPADRPMTKAPAYFVDPIKGDDAAKGTQASPWKTIAHAAKQLKPGDVLCLRGGRYYEELKLPLEGTGEKPITIRSFPGELAILDGGFREFFEIPQMAWEPFDGGAKGEYRSTKKYDLGKGRRDVALVGNFGDSMVPLHGYRFLHDFRTDNEYWNVGNKLTPDKGVYCGPGLWYDAATQRIHVRLAHLHLKALGAGNYRGETDPRKLPLVVATHRTPLTLEKAKHLRFQDLVIRGSAGRTVVIDGATDVEFDGCAIYGGAPAMHVRATHQLRLMHSAVRGLSAQWSSRASHKYRSLSPYLFIAAGDRPQNTDFEFAHCAFTDNHDGLIVGTIKGLKFHHNYLDNFDDDGVYLTLSRADVPEGIHIYQNYFERCLSWFAHAESGKGVKNAVGPGVFITRNVFDIRRGTYGWPPPDAAADDPAKPAGWTRESRLAGDHGSPVWEPMFFYHNTVLTTDPTWRDYYALGMGAHTGGSKRRVFNNILVQAEGLPGLVFPTPEDDLQADGNLLWGPKAGPAFKGDFFARFRASKVFEASKKRYPDGFGAKDVFADPKFVELPASPFVKFDLRLQKGSPAIDRGVELPADWPDPLRKLDKGKPDIGALPLGVDMEPVGPRRSAQP